jgi:hypothetical protein
VAIASTNEAMVPMEPGEAIWIGVSVPRDEPGPHAVCVRVTAKTDAGSQLSVLSAASESAGVLVPPTASITGIARSAGSWLAIARVVADGSQAPATRSLEVAAVPTRAVHAAETRRDDVPFHSLALGAGQSRSTVVTCDAGTDGDVWDHTRRAHVVVVLVSHEAFAAVSDLALPEPLDASQPYRGWRLP